MSGAKRGLTTSERALWRRVLAAVEPMQGRALPPEEPDPVPIGPTPKHTTIPKQTEVHLGPPTRRSAPAPLADRGGEKRVRRGQVDVEAVIDLHGRTLETAHVALSRFLHDSHRARMRCVLVITGKGVRGEGAIRRSLTRWLDLPDLRAIVSGTAQAHRTHGGEGAFYVFLRKPA